MRYESMGIALAASFVLSASQAAAPPVGPIADMLGRLDALEHEVEVLKQSGGANMVMLDVNDQVVGLVLTADPLTALITREFRGKTWKFILDRNGPTPSPTYINRFFVTTDCSGPAYFSAGRFDGTYGATTSVWGDGFLPYDKRDLKFKLPVPGTAPVDVVYRSVDLGRYIQGIGSCLPMEPGEVSSAYPEHDLEIVDPFEGFMGPYRVAPAD